ncbi:hypothetical protein [Francisella persica]|uniref:hypothetical protein n=1 Tax=Francisella persica TaxID=954 RepID=UPI000A6A1A69|nr:hypothetical protein [Francisella persica]
MSELFIDSIALSEIKRYRFLSCIIYAFTGNVAEFIGAKAADLAAFQGNPNNFDLVKQV